MGRMKKTLFVIALLLTGVWLYPPARFVAFVLIGRGTNCSYDRAAQSAKDLNRQIRYKDEILASSKLLEIDASGFKKYQTSMGDYWIPIGSEFVLPYNLAEIKRSIYFDKDHDIKHGDVVLDCGANIGVFTRKAISLGAAKVVAIEPSPENLECLRRNFKKEIDEGRVVVYGKGVWNQDAVLPLHVNPKNSAANSFVIKGDEDQPIQNIPLTTIDKLVSDLHLEKIDFIKMDIEGAEPRALEGATATLREFKPKLSISSYHAENHPTLIPEIVIRSRTDYQMSCGPCAEIAFGVRPDILFFQ